MIMSFTWFSFKHEPDRVSLVSCFSSSPPLIIPSCLGCQSFLQERSYSWKDEKIKEKPCVFMMLHRQTDCLSCGLEKHPHCFYRRVFLLSCLFERRWEMKRHETSRFIDCYFQRNSHNNWWSLSSAFRCSVRKRARSTSPRDTQSQRLTWRSNGFPCSWL
jgi:hypothetical protein